MKAETFKNTSLLSVTMTKAEYDRYQEFTGHEKTVSSIEAQRKLLLKQAESLAQLIVELDDNKAFQNYITNAIPTAWRTAVEKAKDILS